MIKSCIKLVFTAVLSIKALQACIKQNIILAMIMHYYKLNRIFKQNINTFYTLSITFLLFKLEILLVSFYHPVTK